MTEAKLVGRNEILEVDDVVAKRVTVPEWKGDVLIKTMSGVERDKFEKLALAHKRGDTIDSEGLRAELVAMTLVDENGVLLFTVDDIVELNKKNGAVLDRLATIAAELNGLGAVGGAAVGKG